MATHQAEGNISQLTEADGAPSTKWEDLFTYTETLISQAPVTGEVQDDFHSQQPLYPIKTSAKPPSLPGVTLPVVPYAQFSPAHEAKYVPWRGKLRCIYCAAIFHSRRSLNHHLLKHNDEAPYACSVCLCRFSQHVDMKKHEGRHSIENLRYCDMCGHEYIRDKRHIDYWHARGFCRDIRAYEALFDAKDYGKGSLYVSSFLFKPPNATDSTKEDQHRVSLQDSPQDDLKHDSKIQETDLRAPAAFSPFEIRPQPLSELRTAAPTLGAQGLSPSVSGKSKSGTQSTPQQALKTTRSDSPDFMKKADDLVTRVDGMRIVDSAEKNLDQPNNPSRPASESGTSSIHSLGEKSFIDGESYDTYGYTWQENRALTSAAEAASKDLIQAFVARPAENQDQRGQGSKPASQPPASNGVNDNRSGSPSSNGSWTNIVVRQQSSSAENREEEDDDDTRRPPKRARTLPDPPDSRQIRVLACPYHKFDRRRYSEKNLDVSEKEYRGCASAFIRDINRLKQHLYRVHRRPEHYCSCCYEIFESRDQLDCHIRRRSCEDQESPFAEKMTVDQAQSIKRRVMKQGTTEAWKDIFRTLFPGAIVPGSPYPELDIEPDESLNEFIEFVNSHGPSMLSAMLDSDLFGDPLRSIAEQSLFDTTVEIAVGRWIQRLCDEYTSRPLQAPDLHQEQQILPSRTSEIDPAQQ